MAVEESAIETIPGPTRILVIDHVKEVDGHEVEMISAIGGVGQVSKLGLFNIQHTHAMQRDGLCPAQRRQQNRDQQSNDRDHY